MARAPFLNVKNAGAIDKVLAKLTRVEKGFVQKTREAAYAGLETAAETSPQFSGTFASNWRLSIGSPRPGKNRYSATPDTAEEEGNLWAVDQATGSPGARLSGLHIGGTVFLSTQAQHSEQYAWKVENNMINFRDVNPSGGRVLMRARDAIRLRFREIKARKS